jgi:hypothetical protein
MGLNDATNLFLGIADDDNNIVDPADATPLRVLDNDAGSSKRKID